MISLLVSALIPTISSTALAEHVPQSQQQVTQQQKNREFIVKHYPPGALKRGEQGRVAFRLTIEPDGSLGKCEVRESSGFAGLDNETCDILVRYGYLKPVMGPDGRTIRATRDGFIVWRIPEGRQLAIATLPVPKTMGKPDDLICKRSRKTGSLIATTRQCMTERDWVLQYQMWRDELERIQGRGHSGQGN